MTQEDAEKAAGVLLLTTARTLRRMIEQPLRQDGRHRMLAELAAALAPFERRASHEKMGPPRSHDPACAVVFDVCGNAECDCGAWEAVARMKEQNLRDEHGCNGELPKPPLKLAIAPEGEPDFGAFGSAAAALDWLRSKRPFSPLLHPDGEFTVSALALPQFALVKTPHRENAELVAMALNQWAAGPLSDEVLAVTEADLKGLNTDYASLLKRADKLEQAVRWALNGTHGVPPLTSSSWRNELRRRAGLEEY